MFIHVASWLLTLMLAASLAAVIVTHCVGKRMLCAVWMALLLISAIGLGWTMATSRAAFGFGQEILFVAALFTGLILIGRRMERRSETEHHKELASG